MCVCISDSVRGVLAIPPPPEPVLRLGPVHHVIPCLTASGPLLSDQRARLSQSKLPNARLKRENFQFQKKGQHICLLRLPPLPQHLLSTSKKEPISNSSYTQRNIRTPPSQAYSWVEGGRLRETKRYGMSLMRCRYVIIGRA